MKLNYFRKPNILALIGFSFLALLPFFVFDTFSLGEKEKLAQENIYSGEVRQIVQEREVQRRPGDRASKEQDLLVEVEIDSQRKTVSVVNDFLPVSEGARVYVQGSSLGTAEEMFYIVDASRKMGLFWLTLFFIILVVLVTGIKGIYSLAGLLVSFSVIFHIMIPRLLQGDNPVVVGLISAFVILLVTLYLSYGVNRKSISALIGISLTLLFVGLLATYTISALYFSGFSAEEALYLNSETNNTLSLTSILIAGIIIAAIGILDDIAITQAATVFSLASIDPTLRGRKLFSKAMEIGKDHISAVLNTLVLAYTGAALPLLLLLSIRQFPLGFVINGEIVAEEIVRTIISSSGLILAVPLTTAIAVWFQGHSKEVSETSHSH